eukprot:207504_1
MELKIKNEINCGAVAPSVPREIKNEIKNKNEFICGAVAPSLPREIKIINNNGMKNNFHNKRQRNYASDGYINNRELQIQNNNNNNNSIYKNNNDNIDDDDDPNSSTKKKK